MSGAASALDPHRVVPWRSGNLHHEPGAHGTQLRSLVGLAEAHMALPRLTFWRVVLIVLVIVVAVNALLQLPFDLGNQVPIPREEIVDPTIP